MPVDPSDVVLSPNRVAQRAPPGETVSVELTLENRATEIPADEPRSCEHPETGEPALSVEVSATVGSGNTVDTTNVCLLPDDSIPVVLSFEAPHEPGEYPTSYTARSQPGDEPMVYDGYSHTFTVATGPNRRLLLGAMGVAVVGGELIYRRYTDG